MDPLTIGTLVSGLGSAAGAYFGGRNMPNPADAGMSYLNQVPDTISPYYNPYINAGRSALPQLQGQYNQLINDPSKMMAQWGSQYQQSPGYQFNVDQGTAQANRVAAAGGMLGSPAEQAEVSKMTQGYANQDYQKYMDYIMGLYGIGINGLNGINTQGYAASNDLANSLGENLGNQANMAYAGQANQNMARQSGMGGAAGMLGQIPGNMQLSQYLSRGGS